MDVYLDHAGAAIPPKDLLEAVFSDLVAAGGRIGNPHSSSDSIARIEEARLLVLHFFGINSKDWDVVFTSGGTSSLRLVGELCPFGDSGRLLYTENMHTSVLSLRCYAKNVAVFPSSLINPQSEANVGCADSLQASIVDAAEEALGGVKNDKSVYKTTEDADSIEKKPQTCVDLLVTSGECNFSGQRSCLRSTSALVSERNNAGGRNPSYVDRIEGNLQWVRGGPLASAGNVGGMPEGCAQAYSLPFESSAPPRRLLWLLDASKLASTAQLNLSSASFVRSPDFVAVSFYKIFGYPTGLGALLLRREAADLLRPQKRYFGGGTLAGAVATEDWSVVRDDAPHAWLEDGTQHFLGVASLRHGFDMVKRRGGLTAIGGQAGALSLSLAGSLLAFHHSNCVRLVDMYGSHEKHVRAYEAAQTSGERELVLARYLREHGPTISFNLRWNDGSPVGYAEVGRLAALRRIRLRTGCFCNVGACQLALQLSVSQVKENLESGRTCWDEAPGTDILNGQSTGAVRVSLGLDSTPADVEALLIFLKDVFVDQGPANLHKEAHVASGDMPSAVIHLSEMFVYPIKGCGGLPVHTWPLSASGLLLDREWVVSDSSGRALTLKTHPRLALIRPTLDIPTGTLVLRCAEFANAERDVDSNAGVSCASVDDLTVAVAPGTIAGPCRVEMFDSGCLALPLDADLAAILRRSQAKSVDSPFESDNTSGLPLMPSPALPSPNPASFSSSVRVCGKLRSAVPVSHDADAWFSRVLGFPCCLLRSRHSDELAYAPASASASASVKSSGSAAAADAVSAAAAGLSPPFANEAALLLISRESVAHLNELLAEPGSCGTGNFRANLVVQGAAAHDEDGWAMLGINAAKLLVDKPCARCSVVNVNGTTGVMDGSTLRTLASYRRESGQIYFGQFLSVKAACLGAGNAEGLLMLRVESPVEVSRKEKG